MSCAYNFLEHMEGVDGDFGYSLGNLSKEDFKIFHSTVTEQYKEVMLAYKADFSEKSSIADYHKSEVATTVLHEKLWPKVARILSQQRLDQIKKTEFFVQLQKQLKWCEITDEENVGRGEIYFRLCRPLPFLDIGPLHADAWFWELGHGSMSVVDFETQRVKIWFCLESEEEKTGFKYVPGSHKNIYDYGGELRGGFIKPTFDEANYDLDIRSLTGGAGKFIIFNDRLLHGGEALYSGTRVSVELTLVIDKNWRKRK